MAFRGWACRENASQPGLSGKLFELERNPGSDFSSGSGGRDFPFLHGGFSEIAHGISGSEVTFDVEGIVDGAVGGNELLCLALRLEPLHLPLSSSDRKM